MDFDTAVVREVILNSMQGGGIQKNGPFAINRYFLLQLLPLLPYPFGSSLGQSSI